MRYFQRILPFILIALAVLPWTRPVSFVLISLLLHEWAHIFVARWFGAKAEIAGFTAVGYRARVRKMDNLHPRERFWVYLAGPAMNLLLAGWAFTVHYLSYVGVFWLRDFAFYNIVLAGFNLLPLLPLDGGRVAQYFLGNVLGILRANRGLLCFGRGAALVLAVLGFVQIVLFSYNITLLCAAIYLWRKNAALHAELRLECFLTLQKKPAVLHGPRGLGKFKVKRLKIPAQMSVLHAVERLGWSHMKEFWIDGKPVREEVIIHCIFKPGELSGAAMLGTEMGTFV